MTIPCSVYMVTLNCEAWLNATLQSVSDFAEVIILDSGSTDATYEIAQRFSNVMIKHQVWQGYAKQKALALDLCQQDWVLNLDGDEEVSSALRANIVAVIAKGQVDGLIIPIRDAFIGKLSNPHTKYHAKIRFFRRGKGSYELDVTVHEGITVIGHVQRAQGEIYHYGDQNITEKVAKDNTYSLLKAEEKNSKGKQAQPIKLLLVMPVIFIKSYVIRRNFLNGWRGFISSMTNAFYAFLKEAKLYEQNQKNSRS